MKLSLSLLGIFLFTDVLWAQTVPAQLQIMQPMSIQEDLLGKVKSVEGEEYKGEDNLGASEGRTREVYNQWGLLVENDKWDESGTLQKKEVAQYDNAGNIINETTSDSKSITSTTTYQFDVNAKSQTATVKDSAGNLLSKTVSIYDNFGKEHEVTHFDGNGEKTERTTMVRNGVGKETTVDFYGKDGQLETEVSLTWNSDGSKAEEIISRVREGKIYDITYSYKNHDIQGNWTDCTETTTFKKDAAVTGSANTYIERVVTYQ